MKKKFYVAAAVVAASCAVVLSGCGGCNTKSKNYAALSSNWYADTTVKDIQPTIIGEENAEIITYKVTHAESEIKNSSYSVSYADGVYATMFFADEFDLSLVADAHRDGYKDAAKGGGITAYCYRTALSLPEITFKCGENSKTFTDDYSITECWFLPVKDYLRPLYSKQVIKSATPANYQASSLENCYTQIIREYENFYSFDGTEVITKKTLKEGDYAYADAQEKVTENIVGGLDRTDNSMFDSSALNIAARACNLKAGASLSQVVSLYSPEGGMQDFTLKGDGTALSDGEKTAAAGKLDEKGLYVATESGLITTAVTVTYGGTLPGVSQTYWFAAIGNAAQDSGLNNNGLNNTGRATMVKLSTPLAYNLGTLTYTLETINVPLWNN